MNDDLEPLEAKLRERIEHLRLAGGHLNAGGVLGVERWSDRWSFAGEHPTYGCCLIGCVLVGQEYNYDAVADAARVLGLSGLATRYLMLGYDHPSQRSYGPLAPYAALGAKLRGELGARQ